MILPDEAIAAFRHHLIAGAFGDRELLMPADQDYGGMWSALCARLVEWQDRWDFDHPVIAEVRATVHQLADQRPNAVKVFALATTRYGQEDEYK